MSYFTENISGGSMMVYVIGFGLIGLGIAMFRKGGIAFRIIGCVVVFIGVGAVGLSVMTEAKKQGML